jgi:hypothetical protein
VFDGFDHPDVSLDTLEFVRSLLIDVASETHDRLRLVLLGCPDGLVPPSLEPSILRETVAPLGQGEIAEFFERLVSSGAVRIRSEQVPQVVDAVMRLGPDPRALNAAVTKTLRLLQ